MENLQEKDKKSKIYIICGEDSGDFIASLIIEAMKQEAEFYGIGGEKMSEKGFVSFIDMKEINLIGFFEILSKLFVLRKIMQKTIDNILEINPDILITIDSPGFNNRIARKIKKANDKIPILQIVAPSVWAYGEGRAKIYPKLFDHLLTILPFEAQYFKMPVTFIGHPVFEKEYYSKQEQDFLKKQLKILENKKLISVTFGSRITEIKRHMPIFCSALNILYRRFSDFHVIFVASNKTNENFIIDNLRSLEFSQEEAAPLFCYDVSLESLKVFAAADLALAKSGTNTLEIALCQTPMVVCYKVNYFTSLIIKYLIKIKYVSLLNIVQNKLVVPELLQNNCNPKEISDLLLELFFNEEKRQKQINDMKISLKKLHVKNKPSFLAVNVIRKLLK